MTAHTSSYYPLVSAPSPFLMVFSPELVTLLQTQHPTETVSAGPPPGEMWLSARAPPFLSYSLPNRFVPETPVYVKEAEGLSFPPAKSSIRLLISATCVRASPQFSVILSDQVC